MTDGMLGILESLNINPEDMPGNDKSDDFMLSVLLEKDVFDKCWECSSDFRDAYLKFCI